MNNLPEKKKMNVSENLDVNINHLSSIATEEESFIQKIVYSTAFWIFLAILIMVLLFGLLTPNNVFFHLNTLFTIGLNASQMLIIAVGASYILASGNIDLSIGTNLILSSTIAAKALKVVAGTPEQVMAGVYPNLALAIAACVLAAILSGGFFGLLNGIIITKFKIASFIVTLGTMMIYWGISLVMTSGASEVGIPRALQLGFGHKKVFDLIPLPLIVALLIGFILWIIMRITRFGLYTCAIGSSKEAANRAGVNVEKHLLKVFTMMGVLAGIAGLFDLARFATTNPQGHQTDGLLAVTAAIMGGSSLSGGIASIGGAMLGTFVPVILQSGLVIMRVGAFYQLIGTGIFLIIAVYIDQKRRTHSG